VAIGSDEEPLGKVRVRASVTQAQRLVTWAADWPERTWAVEGAGWLGHLLAQQLVAAGERVLDVQPKLGSRVRLLATGASNKNDPNDALSVAIAALRSRTQRPVTADDHVAVLRVWSRRHRDLGRAKNQVACRLHAVLCELVPGGVPEEITAAQATRILERSTPSGAAGQARRELAAELLDDMRGLDTRIRESKKKLAGAVRASGTTVTDLFGVGPVVAATVIGDTGDVNRFPSRDHFASYNGTAPIEVSSGNRKINRLSLRGNRRINHAIHMAAITQIRHAHSDGRAYYDRKLAEGKTHKLCDSQVLGNDRSCRERIIDLRGVGRSRWSSGERCFRAYHAELVTFRVGQDRPRLGAGLADVDPAGAQRQQTFDLRLAVFRLGGQVEVDPVLERLRLGHRHEAQSDRRVLVWPDDDLALSLGQDVPAEGLRPEPGQPRQVVGVDNDVMNSHWHAVSMRRCGGLLISGHAVLGTSTGFVGLEAGAVSGHDDLQRFGLRPVRSSGAVH
jgi:transposase